MLDVIVVDVGHRRVGILAEVVHEVQAAVTVTHLPGAPGIVEGVINVRGDVVPVIALRRRLGLDSPPPLLSDHLVLADVGGRRVALRVDHARGLRDVDPGRLTPAGSLPGAAYVTGAVVEEDGLLVVLDASRFLSTEDSRALDVALAEPPAAVRA